MPENAVRSDQVDYVTRLARVAVPLASCFVPFCSREPCTRTVLQNDQEYKKFRKFGNIVDSTAKSIIKISVLGIVNSRPISRLFNPPYCRPQRP